MEKGTHSPSPDHLPTREERRQILAATSLLGPETASMTFPQAFDQLLGNAAQRQRDLLLCAVAAALDGQKGTASLGWEQANTYPYPTGTTGSLLLVSVADMASGGSTVSVTGTVGEQRQTITDHAYYASTDLRQSFIPRPLQTGLHKISNRLSHPPGMVYVGERTFIPVAALATLFRESSVKSDPGKTVQTLYYHPCSGMSTPSPRPDLIQHFTAGTPEGQLLNISLGLGYAPGPQGSPELFLAINLNTQTELIQGIESFVDVTVRDKIYRMDENGGANVVEREALESVIVFGKNETQAQPVSGQELLVEKYLAKLPSHLDCRDLLPTLARGEAWQTILSLLEQ